MKTLTLALLLSSIAFGNACTTLGGTGTASNVAATYTLCGGTTPQPADTLIIATPLVLKASMNVVSVSINGATATLTTDGLAPYTLTTSGSVTVTLGCIVATGGCPDAYAIDTSAASTGNEVTFTNTGSGYDITKTVGVSTSINLVHAILQCGTGGCFNESGSNGSDSQVYNFQNVELVGGTNGINISSAFPISISVTINNVWSNGLTAGSFVNLNGTGYMLSPCIISNNTLSGGTTNSQQIIVQAGSGDSSTCQVFANGMDTDAAGTYTPGFIYYNAGGTPASQSSWYLNLAQSNSTTGASGNGISGAPGSSGKPLLLYNNVLAGFSQPYVLTNYTTAHNNLCLAHAYQNGEDGCFLAHGQTNLITSTNDVSVEVSQGGFGFFSDGQMAGANPVTLNNFTSIFPIEVGTCNCGAGIQTGDTDAGLTSLNNGVFNSLFYGGDIGIFSANTANTFLTSGTGGVGVSGNDVYGISPPYATSYGKAAYLKLGTSANYDNGATTHPSATYNDVAVNPFLYDTSRNFARCDELLNSLGFGSGTAAHLFGQLSNRWNGTNGVITASTVYQCMAAPFVPQTGAMGTPASYVGAYPPWIGNAGVQ